MLEVQKKFTALDFSDAKLASGWTKKVLFGFLEEAKRRELLHLKCRMEAMDRTIAMFESTAMAAIACIPVQARELPYFEAIKQFNGNTDNGFLDNLISEAKKRSRLEWEDAVRIRTGKRPCAHSRPGSSRSDRGPRTVQSKKPRLPSTPSMPSIMEANSEIADSITATSKYSNIITTTNNKKIIPSKLQPCIASTPREAIGNTNNNSFAVPTVGRMTRSRTAVSRNQQNAPVLSRLATSKRATAPARSPVTKTIRKDKSPTTPHLQRRFLSPNDNLQTSHGTPIRNPFSLMDSNASVEFSSPEVRRLEELITSVKMALEKHKRRVVNK